MNSSVLRVLCGFVLCLSAGVSRAGDAVIWDPVSKSFVASYSSTPEGGKDYLTGEQALDSVRHTMQKKGVADPVVVWKSDQTGYFAVCTGITETNKTVAAVGLGRTEAEAKVNGLATIRKAGAVKSLYIANRYESYGTDYQAGSPPLTDLTTSPVENEDISSLSPDGHLALCTAHSRGWKLRRLDLINLDTFTAVLELGTPTNLYGSIVWNADGKSFAFFGEERAWGDTTVYFLQDTKWAPVATPGRDKFPDPEFELKPGEHIFKTLNDAVRPKDWLKSGDLELEHIVTVVVDHFGEKIATVDALTTMTVHFDETKTAGIVGVAQETTRKPIQAAATPSPENKAKLLQPPALK
jgi:hypothetical protein